MEQKRMMIVLYGGIGQGKTSTLMQLAINLAGGGSIVTSSIHSTFIRKGKYWDGRLIIRYKERLIYIATGGDSWAICRSNTDFFERDFGNLTIYEVDAKGVRELTPEDKKKYKEDKLEPDVVISACRPDGDGFGAIKALHAYSECALSNYAEQQWVRKRKEDDNSTMAKDIQDRIDKFL